MPCEISIFLVLNEYADEALLDSSLLVAEGCIQGRVRLPVQAESFCGPIEVLQASCWNVAREHAESETSVQHFVDYRKRRSGPRKQNTCGSEFGVRRVFCDETGVAGVDVYLDAAVSVHAARKGVAVRRSELGVLHGVSALGTVIGRWTVLRFSRGACGSDNQG